MSADENSAYKSSVPKRYKKIDIKLGKMGVDDFDFDSYNKVPVVVMCHSSCVVEGK